MEATMSPGREGRQQDLESGGPMMNGRACPRVVAETGYGRHTQGSGRGSDSGHGHEKDATTRARGQTKGPTRKPMSKRVRRGQLRLMRWPRRLQQRKSR
jgi:hypothetical protein